MPRTRRRVHLRSVLACTALALAWTTLALVAFRAIRSTPERYLGRLGEDVDAQHAFLHRRLHDGGPLPLRTMLTHTFYGYSLVNSVLLDANDPGRRTRAVAELRWILERLDDAELRARYAETQVPHGVYYFGQRNLTLAGLLLIDPAPRERDVREFHANSRLLFDVFEASHIAHLESYPEHVWPADNVVALYSLAVHDRLYGSSYRSAVERWIEHISRRLDPVTGLMPAKLHPRTGEAADVPRGVNLAFSIAFLRDFAPELAALQYEAFRRHFHEWRLGLVGVREYVRGVTGPVDVDSGPIVAGIGAGASGLALAAAKAMDDEPAFASLLLSAEVLGMPFQWRGNKRYLFGSVPIVDSIIVWGKTRVDWLDHGLRGVRKLPGRADGRFSRMPLFLLLGLSAGLLFFLTFRRNAARDAERPRPA